MVASISESARFMEVLAGASVGNFRRVQFYTSHEALLLPYEQAQTRQVPHQSGWFNLATHFPWIGLRTAYEGSAHLEYARGIQNPIGVKVGPNVNVITLLKVIEALNPTNEPGKLTLIHRMGARSVEAILPRILAVVKAEGRNVLWCCDPMHGNSETLSNGVKTRRFANICAELESSFEIHSAQGTRLGGVHLELTGENVTECLGGARSLTDADLTRAYKSTVDPRLNYEQSLECGHDHRTKKKKKSNRYRRSRDHPCRLPPTRDSCVTVELLGRRDRDKGCVRPYTCCRTIEAIDFPKFRTPTGVPSSTGPLRSETVMAPLVKLT